MVVSLWVYITNVIEQTKCLLERHILTFGTGADVPSCYLACWRVGVDGPRQSLIDAGSISRAFSDRSSDSVCWVPPGMRTCARICAAGSAPHRRRRQTLRMPGARRLGRRSPPQDSTRRGRNARTAPCDSLPNHVGDGTVAEWLLLDEDDVEVDGHLARLVVDRDGRAVLLAPEPSGRRRCSRPKAACVERSVDSIGVPVKPKRVAFGSALSRLRASPSYCERCASSAMTTALSRSESTGIGPRPCPD